MKSKEEMVERRGYEVMCFLKFFHPDVGLQYLGGRRADVRLVSDLFPVVSEILGWPREQVYVVFEEVMNSAPRRLDARALLAGQVAFYILELPPGTALLPSRFAWGKHSSAAEAAADDAGGVDPTLPRKDITVRTGSVVDFLRRDLLATIVDFVAPKKHLMILRFSERSRCTDIRAAIVSTVGVTLGPNDCVLLYPSRKKPAFWADDVQYEVREWKPLQRLFFRVVRGMTEQAARQCYDLRVAYSADGGRTAAKSTRFLCGARTRLEVVRKDLVEEGFLPDDPAVVVFGTTSWEYRGQLSWHSEITWEGLYLFTVPPTPGEDELIVPFAVVEGENTTRKVRALRLLVLKRSAVAADLAPHAETYGRSGKKCEWAFASTWLSSTYTRPLGREETIGSAFEGQARTSSSRVDCRPALALLVGASSSAGASNFAFREEPLKIHN